MTQQRLTNFLHVEDVTLTEESGGVLIRTFSNS